MSAHAGTGQTADESVTPVGEQGRSGPRIVRVRVDRRNDRELASSPTPAIGWIVESSTRGWRQASASVRLDGGDPQDIATDESWDVAWPFEPLASHSVHALQVRVTGDDGVTSDWSESLRFRTSFLAGGEWRAKLVGHGAPKAPAAPCLLRSEFQLRSKPAAAHLYATAHGVYQVAINGADVDDSVLKPGWTSYQVRTTHDSVDVTPLLDVGPNAIGIRLAGGWWTEEYGFGGAHRRYYGEHPSVAVQLHVRYADGAREVFASGVNLTWRATSSGPLVSSGIYAGETWDLRRSTPGWAEPGFADEAWKPARVENAVIHPEPQVAEPVRRTGSLPVVERIVTPSGRTVLDFGQNLVGRVKFTVSGPAGSAVTLRHAEVLEHGEIGTRPLRRAAATDTFILSGGTDVCEPEFTFHGFRYVEVSGWPGLIDPSAFAAVVVGSDMRRTGWLETSHPLVNRLHENVVWGMRGNFLSIPTDCPQRDERLGWTGDIQVFAPTASYLYDCDAFLSSWLHDLSLEQALLGGVCPIVVPAVIDGANVPAAAWGDAATIVPMTLFDRFADTRVVEDQYPSMRSWVDVVLRHAGEDLLWEGMFQFGDWLDPSAPPDRPEESKTSPDLVASAYLIRSLDLVGRAAELCGLTDDGTRYRDLAGRARAAFRRRFVTLDGRMMSDAPTAYALALIFDLVHDAGARAAIGARLSELVRQGGFRISTGFVGTPIILDALVDAGDQEAAERLLLQTEIPSWLYPVTMGATTMWERWDSMLEDGTINPGEMTSFNHYAFGAVADWLHRNLGGLAPASPGYRRIHVQPIFLPGFDWATTEHETSYGLARVAWRRSENGIDVEAIVPANATAEIVLPGSDGPIEVGSGQHHWHVDVPTPHDPDGLSVDAMLSAVILDAIAYRALLHEVETAGATSLARRLRTRTRWLSRRSLRDELAMVGAPDELVLRVDQALRGLS